MWILKRNKRETSAWVRIDPAFEGWRPRHAYNTFLPRVVKSPRRCTSIKRYRYSTLNIWCLSLTFFIAHHAREFSLLFPRSIANWFLQAQERKKMAKFRLKMKRRRVDPVEWLTNLQSSKLNDTLTALAASSFGTIRLLAWWHFGLTRAPIYFLGLYDG